MMKPTQQIDWQPIESVPEVTRVLVFCPAAVSSWDGEPSPVFIVMKDEDGQFYIEHDADGGYLHWRNLTPTHWMPLPELPR